MKSLTVISVSKSLLRIDESNWKRRAYFYALDHHTLGITGKPLREWQKAAPFSSTAPIKLKADRIQLPVPREFVTFYELNMHRFTTTVNSNNILVTVDPREDHDAN